jgi:hypothetical protein
MSLRTRLSRLEKVRGHAGAESVEAFFRLWEEHGKDPRVSVAEDDVCRRMQEVEAALGRPITDREWLNDRWMESRGLAVVLNGLLGAVHECGTAREDRPGGEK